MHNEFTQLILNLTAEAGVALDEKQAGLLTRHIQLMLEWNTRLNLTRITKSEDIVIKHILDSVLPAKYLPSAGNALDVGSGAGFPGIPLKILCPDLEMVLLDSSRKKISYLTAVIATLGLKGMRAFHGRWQDLSRMKEHSGGFALITMRALKLEPEHLSSLAPTILAPGGILAWWGAAEPGQKATDIDSYQAAIVEVKPELSKSLLPSFQKVGRQNANTYASGRNPASDMAFQGDFDYSLPGIKQRRAILVWEKQPGITDHEKG